MEVSQFAGNVSNVFENLFYGKLWRHGTASDDQ